MDMGRILIPGSDEWKFGGKEATRQGGKESQSGLRWCFGVCGLPFSSGRASLLTSNIRKFSSASIAEANDERNRTARWSLGLYRCAIESDDELNAVHVLRLQARVVGEEEIHVGVGGAGQLNGVRRTQGAVGAQGGEDSGGGGVKRDYQRG